MKVQDPSIEERFEKVTDVFKTIKGILKFGGLWPLARSNLYIFWMIPYVTNVLCEGAYLIENYRNLIILGGNLSEILLITQIIVKVLSMQWSKSLPKLLILVMGDMKSARFNNDEERNIYLIYASMGKTMGTFFIYYATSVSVIYFLKPLMIIIVTALDSSSNITFEFPYAIEPFINYNDYRIYGIIYLLQSSCLVMDGLVAADVALYYMFCLHCCGKLAVLRYRIKQIGINNVNGKITNSPIIFKNSVENYVECLKFIKEIDTIFQISLLQDLISNTGVLALALFTTITNGDDFMILVLYLGFAGGSCVYLFGNCLIGEILMEESIGVSQAYYDVDWYNMPISCQKFIPLCIAGSSKPMKQTACGVFDYSMTNFSGVIKTAMAYLSMLRNVT